MARAFSLEIYPWVYIARFGENGAWAESYVEREHLGPAEEAALPAERREELLEKRNRFPELPLVNYTSQYGLGCFEGLKAFPQKDGSLAIFRPQGNAKRMADSMRGLMMPPFPETMFLQAVREVVRRNQALGFAPSYDPAWEAQGFLSGRSVYIRPFSYTEGGIGVNLSSHPWVIVITTPVGSYFDPDAPSRAVTTRRVRATPGGTGWIKAASNYVTSALAKKEAEAAGYMEAVFLDAKEGKYFEEGSSCNLFFLLKGGTLVTPALGDTILPGITRTSVIQIARDKGLKVEERRVSVKEVFAKGVEAFASGTAAGVTFLQSITHQGREKVFGEGRVGEFTAHALKTLKGIQYGVVEDRYGWMVKV